MADDIDNDDWLYGDTHEGPKVDAPESEETAEKSPPTNSEKNGIEPTAQVTDENTENKTPENEEEEEEKQEEVSKENGQEEETKVGEPGGDEEGEQNGDNDDDDDLDDEDDSDDDVNVVIGDIKTTPSYTSMNIKRGSNLLTTAQTDKSKSQQSGKFTIDEFDQIGMINGVPATEYNVDSLEDKPWRKPGADITDYFNYGFNEDTWRAYCERQKRMRVNESGVGLAAQINPLARAGPPPGRRMTGSIDVIGGTTTRIVPTPMMGKPDAPKMNVIQVMTADRREYSRKPTGFPDMTVPPPQTFEEFQPEYGFNPEPEPFYGGYEPTQDSQWGPEGGPPPPPDWVPSDIKSLTPGPMGPPNVHMGPPVQMRAPSPRSKESPPRAHSRERERSREVSRARSERREQRDRSHRRERSRSRSRRHRSRSRSPNHRSHKKKKSRRHEDSE